MGEVALIIPPDVLKQLAAIPRRDRDQLLTSLEMIAAEPSRRFPFVTEMVGEPGVWRLRKGDWRAVYHWRDADVVLDRVGNRRDIYR
jgi:mRNA-degrading endonuclease RelE of RelBE toxin-antitoxin system